MSDSPRRAAAVLFDMDGLLVDTEPVWYDVEQALVTSLGGRWTHADQAACVGGTLDATARYIVALTGTDRSPEWVVSQVLATMAERLSTAVPVHVGAAELVAAVRDRGVATALVSSSYRVLVDAVLAGLGVGFDVTVAGDEVTRGKPDPEPYLTGCRLLGVSPADTVVLEDALTGIRSAESAGCTVVAVPSLAPIEELPTRPVAARLADVDPEWLLSLPHRYPG